MAGIPLDGQIEDFEPESEGPSDLLPFEGIFDYCRGELIEQMYPDSLNFILGVAYFDMNPSIPSNRVADNREFRNFFAAYFQHRLTNPSFVSSLHGKQGRVIYRVIGEIQAIFTEALRCIELPRLTGRRPVKVNIWKKVSPNGHLRESTWKDFLYKNLAEDTAEPQMSKELREALSTPLKTTLKALYPPQQPAATRSTPAAAASAAQPPDALAATPLAMFAEPLAEGVDEPPSQRRRLKNPMRELSVNEDKLIQDACTRINQPGTYVAALITLYDSREVTPANAYVADIIAEKWVNEENSPPRFIYRFDASDSGTLSESYTRQTRVIRAEHGQDVPEQPKRRRLVPQVAADEFLKVFRSLFPADRECLFIFTNVPHPGVFTEGFLPSMWQRDERCQETIRGVLLCTPHPEYNASIGSPYTRNVSQISVEWTRNESDAGGQWWDQLPSSQPPFCFVDVEEPPGLDRRLEDGRATELVGIGQAPATQVANQAARRWESEGAGRFCIWLDTSCPNRLRDAYQHAIQRVTFGSAGAPIGNGTDLSIRSQADALMWYLARKRELSDRDHRFTLVFADAPVEEEFYHKFFSAQSNWWNSKGRFLVTTAVDPSDKATFRPFHVELEANGDVVRPPLPVVRVEDIEESMFSLAT